MIAVDARRVRAARPSNDSRRPPVDKVLVTDTIRPQASYPAKIVVLSVAPLLAETIRRIHSGKSVSSLFVD